jgi:hypothetical protein
MRKIAPGRSLVVVAEERAWLEAEARLLEATGGGSAAAHNSHGVDAHNSHGGKGIDLRLGTI